MDLEGVKLREISQRKTCHLYVESQKYNELVNITRNIFTDLENKLVVTSWQREERRGNRGAGDEETQTIIQNKQNRYIVQHREYSQYYIITINGL